MSTIEIVLFEEIEEIEHVLKQKFDQNTESIKMIDNKYLKLYESSLKFSTEEIKEVIDEIEKYQNLKSLFVEHHMLYDNIPEKLFNILSLESLTFTNICFDEIDIVEKRKLSGNIGNLINLKSLELSGNGFVSIPNEVGKLASLKIWN